MIATFQKIYARISGPWSRNRHYARTREIQAAEMAGVRNLQAWRNDGEPIPPPAVYKHHVIKTFQAAFDVPVFIETGTFLGQTLEAVKHHFVRLHSIEVDTRLHADAVKKFSGDPHVHVVRDDSQHALPKLIRDKKEKAIFWLDAHYSGGVTGKGEKNSPVVNEVNAVLSRSIDDVILIDDARHFNGTKDYPTLPELKQTVASYNADLHFEVKNDIIRIYGGPPVDV